MNWFKGSIPEAIGTAKRNKAIFVVYVRDSSEASKTTDEVLAHKEAVEVMAAGTFVAIRLENGTEDVKQFSQIYPLVLVPSLFFISGETGVPLEVLGGPLNLENLKDKVSKLVATIKQASTSVPPLSSTPEAVKPPQETSGSNSSNQEALLDTRVEPQTSATVTESSVEEVKADSDIVEASPAAPSPPQHSDAPAASEGLDTTNEGASTSSELTLEEKVERAKTLLAEKQNMTAREKAEEEKQREIDRRKMGQEMAKKKQQQEDDEMRAAARERRKDKEEDRLARERVKAQIAADRADRVARAALLRGEEAPAPPASSSSSSASLASPANAPPQSSSSSNISRLKFRLPDGSSSIAQFSAEAPLKEVHQHVEQNLSLPFTTFSLSSTVHHRPFTAHDLNTPLRDLGLVPSAILVVLPSASSSPGSLMPSGGGFLDFLWLLLSPFTFVLGLVQHYLLGRRQTPTDHTDEPQPKRPREHPPQQPSTRQRPATAYGGRREARFRQEGNIHRLQNDADDDDENNTWNGNSTQQM